MQAEGAHVRFVKDLHPRAVPSGFKAVIGQSQIDVPAAVGESDALLPPDRDEDRLARDLGVEELTPSATLRQPGPLILAPFHDDAAQDPRPARRAVTPETDDARMEAPIAEGARECARARLAE